MKIHDSQITNNGAQKDAETYKEYKRTIYRCMDDDIWISVEEPLIPPRHIA